jgi:hypothetical protein
MVEQQPLILKSPPLSQPCVERSIGDIAEYFEKSIDFLASFRAISL